MSEAPIDPKPSAAWHLSAHARTKARARAVSAREVLEVIAAPDITYTAFTYGPGRYVYQRGEIGVVVVPKTRIVITVLWRHDGQWSDDEFANRHTA